MVKYCKNIRGGKKYLLYLKNKISCQAGNEFNCLKWEVIQVDGTHMKTCFTMNTLNFPSGHSQTWQINRHCRVPPFAMDGEEKTHAQQ